MLESAPARGVIFDFDGVIMDSEPVHEAALRESLEQIGLHLSPAEFHGRFVGMADEAIFTRVLQASGQGASREVIDALHARKQGYMHSRLARGEAPVFPGVVDLVRQLAQRVPLAIASAARRREIDAMLTRAGIGGCFRAIVGVEDVQYTKPDPEPYQRAAMALELDPSHCVAIEDTPTGLASARGAGCRTIGVCHTMPKDRLLIAHRVVERIALLTADDVLNG